MAERGNEKITDWLEIDLGKLSGTERVALIIEIMDTLSAQELQIIRDNAEENRQAKVKDAKSAVIAEMRQKFGELDLTLEEVLELEGNKGSRRVSNAPIKVKYRSPEGETWSGRGRSPIWLKALEAQGHAKEEYKVES
jgi:DNA-binding protein H-NS